MVYLKKRCKLFVFLLSLLKCIKTFINRIRLTNFSLQYRILASFIMLIFIPTIFVLLFIYNIYLNFMSEKVRTYAYETTKEINQNIDSNLKVYTNLTMQIYSNKDIIENMEKSYKDLSEQLEIEKSIRNVLRNLINYDKYVVSSYLISSDGTKYTDGMEFPDIDDRLKYLKIIAEKSDGRVEWVPSEKMKSTFGKDFFIFNAVREIKTSDGTKVGSLMLMLRDDFFEDLYKDINFGNNAKSFIISNDMVVVSSIDKTLNRKRLDDDYLRRVIAMKKGSFINVIDNIRYLVVFSTSDISNWTFVSLIPINELLKEVLGVKNVILLIIILFTTFILILSFIFSSRIAMPVKKLVNAIKQVEEGHFDVSIETRNNDEIGNLSRSFVSMVDKIHGLIRDVKEKEKLKSRAELAALQSQINPHFMYNTLNSIKWIAILNKQENIKNMVSALIDLLKNAAKNNQDVITIRDEIELLKSYTFIQGVRFTNFKTIYNVEKEVMDYKIMKFTLQPIVENSILHGFGKIDRLGEIIISISKLDEKRLHIEIKDNGLGINEKVIGDLLEKEEAAHYNKMGLTNVNYRIKLNYGEDYGLKILSKLGEGTKVELTLPIIQ